MTHHLSRYTVQSADTEAKPPILRVLLADTLPAALDFLSGISHAPAEDGGEDHLEVLEEGVVTEVVEVEADFVGKDYFVVVFLWVGLFCEQFFFVAVFEGSGAGNARTKLQYIAVIDSDILSGCSRGSYRGQSLDSVKSALRDLVVSNNHPQIPID